MPQLTRRPRGALLGGERGFTLPEVLITIVLMGILFGIASSTWFGVVEGRRVDSAANQIASDLRLAHTQASNRLADHTVVVSAANSSTYQIGPAGGTLATRTLPEGTRIAAATTIVFESDGEAQVTGDNPIEVRSTADTTEKHTIDVNTMTSRIQIDP
ncbi:MAG: GspH/FimT family pseudopilin [Actinomycetota bacterium]|nr:GspH/FimT family pseudopilin [Actinomycetota bacterium]